MEELLASYPELERKRNIVQCSLSGHEMPARLGVVRAYVEGKKFQKLKAERDFKFQRLEPFIKPSLKRKRQLFCALTNRYMNRKPAEVALHLQGKRYRRAMEKYNSGQLVLFTERLRKKKLEVEKEVKTKEVEEEEEVEVVEEEKEVVEEEEEEEEEKEVVVDGGSLSCCMECEQSGVGGMDSGSDPNHTSKAVTIRKRRRRSGVSSSPLPFRGKPKRRRRARPVASDS